MASVSAPQRILFVSSYGPKHVGGIERVVHNLARIYSEDPNMTVEWCVSECALVKSVPHVRYISMRTWNFFEKHIGLPYPIWTPGSLMRLQSAVRRADVVHIHDYIYMGSIAAFAFAKWYRRPIVITQHIAKITFRNPLLSLLLQCINRTIGWYILTHADELVCVAEHVRQYFSGFVKRNINVVLNGVDETVFMPGSDPESVREELRLPVDRPLLLYVGRFVEKKGIAVLHHLARRTPHCTWLLIGSGHMDPTTWELPNVIVHAPIANNDEQLVRYYQSADLFVFPAQGEGFPLVLMEALACGLPVMLSEELLIPDPIPEGACVVVDDKGQPSTALEDWESALSDNISEPRLKALRATVPVSNIPWKWTATADRYLDLYTSAMRHRTKL